MEKNQQASDSKCAKGCSDSHGGGTFRMQSAANSAELGVKQHRFGLSDKNSMLHFMDK
jgi:hypothetical protein